MVKVHFEKSRLRGLRIKVLSGEAQKPGRKPIKKTKVCNYCGKRKKRLDFAVNHRTADGRLNVCRVCCEEKRQAKKAQTKAAREKEIAARLRELQDTRLESKIKPVLETRVIDGVKYTGKWTRTCDCVTVYGDNLMLSMPTKPPPARYSDPESGVIKVRCRKCKCEWGELRCQ